MPTSPARGRWTAVLRSSSIALLALAPLAACSDEGSDDPPPTADATTSTVAPTSTARAATTTTTEPLTPEQQVEQAYLAMYRVLAEASTDPSRSLEGLEDVATGATLTTARESIANLRRQGQYVRFPADIQPVPSVESIKITTARSASLVACLVDDGILTSVSDDRVVDDEVVSKLTRATLTRVGGRWKVETAINVGSWGRDSGCGAPA